VDEHGVEHPHETSDKGVWDSGNLVTNATYTRVFSSTGTFAFHCNIHPAMTGSIVVS